MDNIRKFEDFLDKMQGLIDNAKKQGHIIVPIEDLENAFPELVESEDEQHRKWILEYLYDGLRKSDEQFKDQFRCAIAWLEKQESLTTDEEKQGKEDVLWCIKQAKKYAKDENEMGTCWFAEQWLEKQGNKLKEKKTDNANKAVPKFKVGNWIVTDKNHIWLIDEDCSTTGFSYRLISQNGKVEVGDYNIVDEHARLWTIKDAKDGDVLVSESNCGLGTWYCIFKSLDDDESMTVYCYLARDGRFETKKELCFDKDPFNTKPATKEQRDTLMKAMADAGYTFDFEKKELKKIPNALEECEIEHVEHGKYYYCIKDYYSGGCKRASKGEVVQALRGMSMMALGAEANKYFIPVKGIIDIKHAWNEEDKEMIDKIIDYMKPMPIFFESTKGESGEEYTKEFIENATDWLQSIKDKVEPQLKQ